MGGGAVAQRGSTRTSIGDAWYRVRHPFLYLRCKDFCQTEFGGAGWVTATKSVRIVENAEKDASTPSGNPRKKTRTKPPEYQTIREWCRNLTAGAVKEETGDRAVEKSAELEIGRQIAGILNEFLKLEPAAASAGEKHLYVNAELIRKLSDPRNKDALDAVRNNCPSIRARAVMEAVASVRKEVASGGADAANKMAILEALEAIVQREKVGGDAGAAVVSGAIAAARKNLQQPAPAASAAPLVAPDNVVKEVATQRRAAVTRVVGTTPGAGC